MSDEFNPWTDDWGEDFDWEGSDEWDPSQPLPPFAEESDFEDDILALYGAETIEDVTVNVYDLENVAHVRGERFATVEDALYYLYELGVIAVGNVVEMELNVYAVAIPDDSNPYGRGK